MHHTKWGAVALLIGTLFVTSCGENSTSVPASPTPSTSLSQLTVTPSSVTGGDAAQGEVRLSAPASGSAYVVNISSGAPAATVPATVAVPVGGTSTSFTIATQQVEAETTVTINALAGVETRGATLVIRPPAPPVLDRLQVDSSFEGGQSTVGTVHLDKPAPSAVVVTLSSQNSGLLAVPPSVTIAAGASSATFTVASRTVSVETVVTISGSAGGQTRTANIVLRPRATPVPGPGTFFSYTSASGDRVGRGQSATIRPSDATFIAHTCSQRQFINIDVRFTSTQYWTLQFVSPQGELRPGTYSSNGTRAPGQPSFFVSSPLGGSCGTPVGRFVVTDAEYLGSATIRRFRATFEQRCERPDAPLMTGEINLIDPPLPLAFGMVLC